jgi:hypothetical protein
MLQVEFFSERILEFVRPAAARAAAALRGVGGTGSPRPTRARARPGGWRHRPAGSGNPATLADPGRRTQGSLDS